MYYKCAKREIDRNEGPLAGGGANEIESAFCWIEIVSMVGSYLASNHDAHAHAARVRATTGPAGLWPAASDLGRRHRQACVQALAGGKRP